MTAAAAASGIACIALPDSVRGSGGGRGLHVCAHEPLNLRQPRGECGINAGNGQCRMLEATPKAGMMHPRTAENLHPTAPAVRSFPKLEI